MDQQLRVKLDVAINVSQDADWWLASCPMLDIVSQGATKKDALRNLREQVSLLFEFAAQKGRLVAMLKKRLAERDRTAHVNRWIRVGLPPEIIGKLGDEALSLSQT